MKTHKFFKFNLKIYVLASLSLVLLILMSLFAYSSINQENKYIHEHETKKYLDTQNVLNSKIDISSIKNENDKDILIYVGFGSFVSLLLFFFLITRGKDENIESYKSYLKESESRFRSLVESLNDWIWEIDAQGNYTYSSHKSKELLGYEVDEIIGKTPLDFIIKEDSLNIVDTFNAILKERKSFTGLENSNLHKDGHIVILETSGVAIIDESGVFLGYRGINRDITERKASEDSIKKLSKRLTMHFQQSPLAVIEWDMDSRIVEWNPAAQKIFGYKEEEIKGKKAKNILFSEDVDKNLTQIWKNVLLHKSSVRSIYNNITKEGNNIICGWHNTALVDEQNNVIGMASIVEDITKQKEAEEKIIYMAYHDSLTGLPNRILFKDRLEQNSRVADRHKHSVGVVLMDMDNFNVVNDTYGHLIGDLLLQEIAIRLKKCFRASDTVGRFGGDEFAVIIPELVHVEDIENLFESVYEKFKLPFNIKEREFFVSFSSGYTIYPLDDRDLDNLIRNADTAMHRSKKSRRNQFLRYRAYMTNDVIISRQIEDGLRRAIKEEEFVLHYQPQINLIDAKMTGVEVLLRWQSPQDGLILPDKFISIAEDSGLIVPIGWWILRTACKQAKAWQEQGLKKIILAVNLSARQFREEGFAQSVIDTIKEVGLESKYIELELTESILINNNISIMDDLNLFKREGIKISIDDFGTGYSSLSYLRHFPIDKIKIDQSFVSGINKNENDNTLIRAIISMSLALNLKTIAEGVETQEQLDFLLDEGCEEIQGYLKGKAMPAKELAKLL